MDRRTGSLVRARHEPLRRRYRDVPDAARIVDRASACSPGSDPFHGRVVPGARDYGVDWRFGIHAAVGGDHDLPNPGDMLCAALASCLDSTLRMLAERLGVGLDSLRVTVTAEVDVRGTLRVDPQVPVGFQAIRCEVAWEPRPGSDPQLLARLAEAAEYSCVNLQTLREGVEVTTRFVESGVVEARRG